MSPLTDADGPRVRRLLVAMRAASLVAICAALLFDALSLPQQLAQHGADFASYYVAARALARFPASNPYDFHAMTQLNAVVHYVNRRFLPFIYPPAALILLRPIVQLPFARASELWTLFTHSCAVVSALLLADAFATVVRRKRAASGGGAPGTVAWLRMLLCVTDLRIGRLRLPLVPLALCLPVMFFAYPTQDTEYFGQINLVVLVFLLLALDAHLHDRPIVAGAAVAVAGALKLTPLIVLGFFLARGSWRAIASGVAVSLALAALPLVMGSFQLYPNFLASLQTVEASFVPQPHNESLIAFGDHVVSLISPSATTTLALVQRGVELGAIALAAFGIGLLVIASVRSAAPASLQPRPGTSELDRDWLGYALVLAGYILMTPVTWAHYYVLALPVALMLAAYPVLRDRTQPAVWTTTDSLMLGAAAASLALLCVPLPFNADHAGSLAAPDLALMLRALRPLATLALWSMLALYLWRSCRPLHLIRLRVRHLLTTTQGSAA